jgi:hypothetical protein
MRYRLFGLTGLRVPELFLGAMTFGEQGGVGAPPEECDYEQPLAFCRDVFGLPERAAYESPGGRVTILEAGALELADPPHAEYID